MNDVMHREYTAWGKVCDSIQKTFGISKKEFNESPAVKELVKRIEEWAYYEHKRRLALGDEQARGVFWGVVG